MDEKPIQARSFLILNELLYNTLRKKVVGGGEKWSNSDVGPRQLTFPFLFPFPFGSVQFGSFYRARRQKDDPLLLYYSSPFLYIHLWTTTSKDNAWGKVEGEGMVSGGAIHQRLRDVGTRPGQSPISIYVTKTTTNLQSLDRNFINDGQHQIHISSWCNRYQPYPYQHIDTR